VYPQNAYRNGALYASYTAAMMKHIFEMADRRRTNIEGMLTWAFEFEDQPYFDGFRTLATNGIDKPVLNVFRMAALMRGDRVQTESGNPGVDALAARADREISVLAWNYHDDDVPAPDADVRLEIAGVPGAATRALLRHYRIDEVHSNAWTAWKTMGSPQHPTPEQYARLEAAGQLQLADSPRWVDVRGGAATLEFSLPSQAVSLLELSW
jgi:xylan 1,4-beta-xylosidase